jgi:hypothetical protein
MQHLTGGAWVDVADGCPVHCSVSPSNEGYLLIGEAPHTYELTLAHEPMRELVAQTAAALAKMEATARQHEAERVARERSA